MSAGTTPRMIAAAPVATKAPANAPTSAPRSVPAGRRPSAAASSPRTRAAKKETATSAAPAITKCQLPPGRIAVLPMSGWRRLPQRTSRIAKSQILIAGRAERRRSTLASGQKRRLDVVADKLDLSVHDAPVERLRRRSLREHRLVGHRDVAAGVGADLIA